MGKSKVILPNSLVVDPRRMALAIKNALDAQALSVKVDFEVTSQTWSNKPAFVIRNEGPWTRVIGTSDNIYTMLNEGTRPHAIAPRNSRVLVFQVPFKAKTVPNSISSGSGSKGNTTVIRGRPVNHPGTEARNWDKAIAKKHRKLFRVVMQRAIDAAAS